MRKIAKFMLTQTGAGRLSGPFLRKTYERRLWLNSMNLFHGVFESHQAAVDSCPAKHNVGWNETGIARNLVGEDIPQRPAKSPGQLPILLHQTSTFAVMLWLSKVVKPGTKIVDVGGASGLTYWHYRDYFDLPADATWTVVDMPEITARGRALAERNGAGNLKFADDIAMAGDCDVLVSLGCIQYMSPADFQRFVELSRRAKTVIINKMPLVDRAEYWTLQSLQSTVVPYWIANRGSFLEAFEASGKLVKDAWSVPELTVEIPFAPEYYVDCLKGVVLAEP